jgi:uncharacterized protein (DUF2252 family)
MNADGKKVLHKSDVTSRINRFNEGRDSGLALKYRAIADNSFLFLRGTCHLFYEDLATNSTFETSPSAWLCLAI